MTCTLTTSGSTALLHFNGRHVATFAKSDIELARRVADMLNAPVEVEPAPGVYYATHVRTSTYVAALDGLAALLKPTERQALRHGNGTAAVTKALAGAGLVVDGKRTPLGDDVVVHLT